MIQFDKDLATNKHLWVFNNNIIKFHSDGAGTPLYADIVTAQYSARVYADPNGIFTYNFKKHLEALANTNNLSDVIELTIGVDVASLVHNDTANVLFSLSADITISFSDADPETVEKNYSFLAGVEQLIDFQKQENPQLNLFLLQNPLERKKVNYHVNYWEGYPFDLSVYCNTSGNLNILNTSNALDVDVPIAGGEIINRIAFCDAKTNVTINDFLPLKNGWNRLQVTRPGYDPEVHLNESPLEIVVNKHEADCGVYVKFRNEKGGWTYWLFHKNNAHDRSSKGQDAIANDFSNIEDTTAPELQTGVSESQDRISCLAVGVTKADLRTLEYIIDSPTIYLFTGERYSVNNNQENQWIEVERMTNTIKLKDPLKMKSNIPFEFKLPQRNKVSLL